MKDLGHQTWSVHCPKTLNQGTLKRGWSWPKLTTQDSKPRPRPRLGSRNRVESQQDNLSDQPTKSKTIWRSSHLVGESDLFSMVRVCLQDKMLYNLPKLKEITLPTYITNVPDSCQNLEVTWSGAGCCQASPTVRPMLCTQRSVNTADEYTQWFSLNKYTSPAYKLTSPKTYDLAAFTQVIGST